MFTYLTANFKNGTNFLKNVMEQVAAAVAVSVNPDSFASSVAICSYVIP
jgi:hypothetical protein